MSFAVVAKKEFNDSVRSYVLIGLMALFVLFAGGFTYLFYKVPALLGDQNATVSTTALIGAMGGAAGLLIPLIGIVVGYKSIVGERASGSLNILLSLPHTRRDVVIGKLLGRTAVVIVSIIVGFAVAGVVGLAFYDSFSISAFVLFTLVSIIASFVFVAIAIAFSSAVRSTTLALAGAIGLYFLFQFIWAIGLQILWLATVGFDFSAMNLSNPPVWFTFSTAMNPIVAYDSAAKAFIDPLPANPFLGQSDAFFAQEWFGFVILVIWLLVPLALGYLRFNSTDL